MTIRVALHHTTRYRYDRPVILSPQVVRLRPAPHCRTPIEAYSLRISPKQHFINWQQDPFGNYQARLVFPEPSDELSVEVDLVAEMTVINPFDFFLDEHAEHFPFEYPPALRRDLAPYLARGSHGSKFTDLAELARVKDAVAGRRTIDVLVDLNRRVQQKVHYDIRMEPGVFEPEETLERGHGSCRDFAWLLVQLLRNLGLAARFVSGYSIQLKADEKPVVGPAGVESDATDLHAWAEVYLPGAGWVGLDATSGLLAAKGTSLWRARPIPSGAAPITGSFDWHKRHEDDKVKESFAFAMKVMRVREDRRASPCPTARTLGTPSIRCGKAVERALEAGDVRLTMGGEPTFVAGGRSRGRRVEHRRARAHQAQVRERAPTPALPAVHTRWLAARRARASGTPASLCLAGRSLATSAKTASPSGATLCSCEGEQKGDRYRPRRAHASWRRSPRRWASKRGWPIPASRTPGTTSGESVGCRSTSIRSTPSSKTSSSARVSRACSSRDLPRSSATRCRCGACGTERPRVESGQWFVRDRAHVPVAGRLADGLRVAARRSAVGRQGGLSAPL